MTPRFPGRADGHTCGVESDDCPGSKPEARDRDTLAHIHDLVAEEHRLRERLLRRDIDPEAEQQHLRAVEAELDQCWDLLRQRRALRRTGSDPGAATIRPVEEVEGYLS